MNRSIRFRNGTYLDCSSIVVGKQLLKQYIDGQWEDITNLISVNTLAVPELEIHRAVAKKNGSNISIAIICKTPNGLPVTDIGHVIRLPSKYAPGLTVYPYCRTNENYDYPLWNGHENIAFCYIDVNGYVSVRTRTTNQKVFSIQASY